LKPIATTLTHKILPPRLHASGKSPLVIFMHGRGANEDDLLGLAEYSDDRIFFVSPRAPFDFGYGGGFTWYEILEAGKPEPTMFAESFRKIVQFHEDVIKGYPVDPSQVYLFGFSMGTIMSYAFALSNPLKVRGVLANSGYIPENAGLVYDWQNVKNTAFHIAHGMEDSIVPVQLARRAKELLTPHAPDLEYHEYPMAHQISDGQLQSIATWIQRRLAM
jgi:phospholipase/carboxylesterase